MNIICFHNPDEENGFLSNWFLSDFIVNGIKFSSLEQYMMYSKAMCFGDGEVASKILSTTDVSIIKQLGRLVSDYDDHYWNGVRQVIVYEGLLQKFAQNDELKRKLIETGDALLVECAVNDKIWANGLSLKDPNRFDPKMWMGKNLLGYSLMLVREKLKAM